MLRYSFFVVALILTCGLCGKGKQRECPQVTNLGLAQRPKKPRADPKLLSKLCRKSWPEEICEQYLQSGVVDTLNDAHREPDLSPQALKGFVADLANDDREQGLPRRFASSELVTSSPAYYFTEVLRTRSAARNPKCQNASASLHQADEATWASTSLGGLVGCSAAAGPAVCKCRKVICWTSAVPADGPCPALELRIVGLVLQRRKPSPTLSALAGLQHLLFLDARASPDIQELPALPQVRTLMLGFRGRARVPPLLPDRVRWLSLEQNEHTATSPDLLVPVCSLRELQAFHAPVGVLGLPPCIGSLSELLAIDIRGGFLGDLEPPASPLPRQLENLTKLVLFVAFEQGVRQFDSSCPSNLRCRPTYQAILEGRRGEGKFRCPGHQAWAENLNTLPIFKWPNLEKFWVDASGLWATSGFFARAVAAWPRLRSLDLYDNNLSVDASELAALVDLPLLQLVQLQYNNLSGVFPSAILDSVPDSIVDVQLNKHLEGCVASGAAALQRFAYTGTKIRVSRDCKHGALEEL